MNSDSYKIIISLSHHRISYEYWQRDGENKLVPMPNGNWPAPLAFFCSDTGIIIGEDAARAAHTGIASAFDNYFDRLAEDTTYNIVGQKRPIRNLLLDASESIFSDFFRNVLYGRLGALSDNRAGMPLIIACEADIEQPERAFLKGLFRDSGYGRIQVSDYDSYIDRYLRETLSKAYPCDNVLVAWAEGTNLTFTLFDTKGYSAAVQSSYEGLGIDPRIEYVKKLIWERVIGQNPWLMKSNEEDAINKVASDFLASSLPMVNDTIVLSDGRQYHYSLNRNNVDFVQNSDGVSIKGQLDLFLRNNGINDKNRVLLILRGTAAGNSYFERNLSPGFSSVIKSDKELRENVMNLILSEEIPSTVTVDLPPVFTDPGPEIPPVPPIPHNQPESSNPPTPPTPRTPSSDQPKPRKDIELKKKTRLWRELQPQVKGKVMHGQYDVALDLLKEFRSECKDVVGIDSILSNVDESIRFVEVEKEKNASQKADKNLNRQWRAIKAESDGKSRAGNFAEAIRILESFKKDLESHPGSLDILKSVSEKIDEVKGTVSATGFSTSNSNGNSGSKSQGQATVKNTNRPESSTFRNGMNRNPGSSNSSRMQSKIAKTKGEELIDAKRLKEAREWYRANGDTSKAKLIGDIIRAERSVETRKSDISEDRKSKNRDRINRIIRELQDFINLCNKAGVDTSDYKQLLIEYKKI